MMKTDTCAANHSYRLSIGLLGLVLLWGGPVLACGSFQPRPTSQPTAVPIQQNNVDRAIEQKGVIPTSTSTLSPPPTATPVPLPTATPTVIVSTPVPGTVLIQGEPARIIAANGLNIREQPGRNAAIIDRLGFRRRVQVVDGPVSSDGYSWWRVDDGQGIIGWAATGEGDEEWITPRVGEPQPVNRSPRIGDRVVITIDGQLIIRALPGIGESVITRAPAGSEFSVIAGPQTGGDYFWFRIRSDDGQVEGWAAEGQDEERWLSPLE